MLILHEYEVHRGYQAQEGGEVVPVERLAFEEEDGEYCKYGQGYGFLYHFELWQGEVAAVVVEAEAVGRYHEAIFGKGYAPRQQYDEYKRGGG